MGDEVLKPFNQDVIQPRALLRVLLIQVWRDPLNLPTLLLSLGPGELVPWIGHFKIMEELGDEVLKPFNQDAIQPRALLRVLLIQVWRDPLRRLGEQWEFGSGQDYKHS